MAKYQMDLAKAMAMDNVSSPCVQKGGVETGMGCLCARVRAGGYAGGRVCFHVFVSFCFSAAPQTRWSDFGQAIA